MNKIRLMPWAVGIAAGAALALIVTIAQAQEPAETATPRDTSVTQQLVDATPTNTVISVKDAPVTTTPTVPPIRTTLEHAPAAQAADDPTGATTTTEAPPVAPIGNNPALWETPEPPMETVPPGPDIEFWATAWDGTRCPTTRSWQMTPVGSDQAVIMCPGSATP